MLSKDEAHKFAAVLAQHLDEAAIQQLLASLLGNERPAPAKEYLRAGEIERMLGLSRTTFWSLRRSGAFPAPIKLSAGIEVWSRAAVMGWLAERQAADA